MKMMFLAAAAALMLAGCQPMVEKGQHVESVQEAGPGQFTVYKMTIQDGKDNYPQTIYIVPGATVHYDCGKNCEATVASAQQ
jgi:hypothetical protein